MPRDSLLKAIAATWADTTCSQTRNFYVFNEKEDIILIETKKKIEKSSLFKSTDASWSDTTCSQTRKLLCFSWTGIHKININNKKKMPGCYLLKAVADTWADTKCSQTRNVYAFHEKDDIKLI